MSFLKEFKEFATRGSIIDLAVGVVIGAAFNKIVGALVDNIIMPIVGILLRGVDFKSLSVKVGDAEVKYGMFIQALVEFVIVAFAIFLLIKGINRLQRKKEEAPAAPPAPSTEEKLLTEIRDAIKQKNV